MNLKKSLLALVLLVFVGFAAKAQEKPSPARTAEGMVGDAKITINYSSPAVKGRMIWGDLVPFNEVWRAGANEATTFTTTEDIMVQGEKLPAGTYGFFIIPSETGQSTFIFNKVAKQWGAFNYDSKEDVLRVSVPSGESPTMEERLVYEVKPDSFQIRWEYGQATATLSN
ncbi:DUF2911 domain-containing protein [Algoriphagus halophytocola]|uniref:DUF2911 domain-containing protein n=1 Tax=Algoriphagus halophytocola TaxID=2991499 RepID=A0ABY6MJA0_9BACT|nr:MULTISPECIES: DUF2911 domain-containing protein [unclassified Algoriphagus]UZD23850.1 DUF2911 domain-containing protein [Algoriphagus sp. TR-M5]WBL41219.1 DUF2911 domain-containing protein [Algoriphagus sp. TR-M9]